MAGKKQSAKDIGEVFVTECELITSLDMTMRERNKKMTADDLAKSLFETAALREADIDRIAGSEDLFGGVLARIRAEQTSQHESKAGFFELVNRYRAVLASGAATLLVVSAFGFFLQQKSLHDSSVANSDSASQPNSARSTSAPQVELVKGFTQGSADIFEPAQEPTIQRTVLRQPEPQHEVSAQRASYSQREPEGEFYPVTYVGDGEAARGGRVVRVDLPRSSLFAMGVNVPLENESPTVKADLLIGPDGVTRAIRFVE